ncbi:uncharacterized protein N7484_002973 [Penicillium longicatenatum]|uniref:uncharacterized protein n=1 Tax=Penicillium longicatenatum TaxID=1561947 RepID=UPI0025496356|nr:uncharacterized protein N7484_002973 [Penicillium longicatenatum]KAJ5649250.1 hypothetical protein N7484_002973 [Penicillium longicatenatum]
MLTVFRFEARVSLEHSDLVSKRVEESIQVLDAHLEDGEDIYGVNTGCGGNASTRTKRLESIQKAFLQHHQAGIVPPSSVDSHTLPHDVVRGAMVLRCNSLLRGHSAVRMEIIDLVLQALNHRVTPIIPLRGSISASGDLSPLSYIGGLVEGNSDAMVQMKTKEGDIRTIDAASALRMLGIMPLTLRAKEALGLMNGTAPSAAAAALVLHDTNTLAILVQLLTAMATEALLGSVDNYHEFISQCRPHPGQAEVATNIRKFLTGSKFSQKTQAKQQGLVQDRYALRTAPQWIGPQLEDLSLANQQIITELNSSTDNPLIDVAGDRFHHGGNFQAASVTSAMEKTRVALVMFGRLLVSQCNEIINPTMNKGLSPNLCIDDPSISFTCKAIDINMSSYFSELALISNPVAAHVHVAEMGNQSVNSLALIAARFASQSTDILHTMSAAHLYILCQALDLRALEKDFLGAIEPHLSSLYNDLFSGTVIKDDFRAVWTQLVASWSAHNQLDIKPRCTASSIDSTNCITNIIMTHKASLSLYEAVKSWNTSAASILAEEHEKTRHQFILNPSTPNYLAKSTKEIYIWVRQTLQVPLHRGLVDHPGIEGTEERKKNIGSMVTRIYTAIRDGEIREALERATDD